MSHFNLKSLAVHLMVVPVLVAAMVAGCRPASQVAYKDGDDVYFTAQDRTPTAQASRPTGEALFPKPAGAINGSSDLWKGGRPVADLPAPINAQDTTADPEYYKPGYNNAVPGQYTTPRSTSRFDRYNQQGPSISYGFGVGSMLSPYTVGSPYSGMYGNPYYDPGLYNSYYNNPYAYSGFGSGYGAGWNSNAGWYGSVYSPYGYNSFSNGNLGYGYNNYWYNSPAYWNGYQGYGYNPYYGYNNYNGWTNSNAGNTRYSDVAIKGPSSKPGNGFVNSNSGQQVTYINGNGVGSGGISSDPNGSTGGGKLRSVDPGNPTVSNKVIDGKPTAAEVIDLNAEGTKHSVNVVKDGGLVVPTDPNLVNSYYVRPGGAAANAVLNNSNNLTPGGSTNYGNYNTNQERQQRNNWDRPFNNSFEGGGLNYGSGSVGSSGGGSIGGATPNIGGRNGGR